MSSKRAQNESGATEKKRKKKSCEEAALSSCLEEKELQGAVKEAWRSRRQYSHGDLELDCTPFPHCIIKNFLSSETFVENLQRELLGLNFHEKSNDLYKFKQSDDLRKRKEAHIAGLRTALFGRFRSWLGDVLGVELEPTVDISCARYEYTDVLLCHDDELEGRRVAFILYLVPPWQSSDGGTLDLYATDSNFQPQSIVKSLVPSWNTLVLFEVSPVSFHQVSEVLSQDKCRLSLSGWFHGPSLERPPRHIEPPVPRSPHLPRDETVLMEWVNPVYLDISYQEQIQEEFEDSSEIQLKDFLKEEKFREVSEALRLAQIQWTRRGPANKRNYEVASLDTFPECITACWELLRSESFFLLLSNFTGLRLHYLCPADEDDDDEDKEKQDEDEEAPASSTESSAFVSNCLQRMADKTVDGGPWTGCAVMFLRSLCPDVNLLSLYKDQQRKFIVFKVIKLTLIDSAGGLGGYEILKVHDADPFLGVEVKFVDVAACQQFLESYSSGAVRQSFSQHACRLLVLPQEFSVETQLKAGTHILDLCLDKLDLCLQHIHLSQPERLRDEEIDHLEQQLQNQALGPAPQSTTITQEESLVPSNCFKFQNRVFEDRMLTSTDVQSFSNGVGRQWKHVGRALGKNCRALKGPAIDNLAYEYEREGLYEQAYQLLSRFIQAEGRAAKLSRLVKALEDCKLTSLAENILDVQPRE